MEGEKETEKAGTKNGQITGNIQSGNRFMNRTVTNPKSIELIHKKYGSENFNFYQSDGFWSYCWSRPKRDNERNF